MKLVIKSLLFVLCGFSSFKIDSQIRLRNYSLIYPDSSILYLGFPNYLEFEGVDIDSTFVLKSKTLNKKLVRNNFVIEEFNSIKNNNKDTISLLKDDSIYFKQIFSVKFLTPPKFRIIGINDSVVEKEILMKNAGIKAYHLPDVYKPCVNISYFNLLIIKGKDTLMIDRLTDADKIKYENKRLKFDKNESKWSTKKVIRKLKNLCIIDCPDANKFSKYQIEQIKKLNTGDIIFIDYIRSSPNRCYCIGRTFTSDIKLIIK